jgi:hypothetical protein
LDVAGWHLEVGAALGARAAVYVGDDAALTRWDPVLSEGVGVFPAALEVGLSRRWVFGELRVEEGVAHAGGLEAATALVGARVPEGWGEVRAGRGDVVFMADRAIEAEELLFSVRPVLSRVWLPQHATGVWVSGGWPGRVSAGVGAAWAAPTSDAPYLVGRLDVHPWGEIPEHAGAGGSTARARLGGAVARLDSEVLGRQLGWTVDGELCWRGVGLRGGWVWVDVGASVPMTEAWGEAEVHLLPNAPVAPMVGGRVERVTGLEVDEDVRWLAAGRLGASGWEHRAQVWVEAHFSREVGERTAEGAVVLDGRVERPNDAILVGAAIRM